MTLDRSTIETLDREALIELVLMLVEQNNELRRRIEDVERRGHRQATPFSKGTKKNDPQRPGRKPGKGPFTRRTAPDPSSYSQPMTEVPVAEPRCPDCGGELLSDGHEVVTRTDLPPIPKPEIRAWHIQICRCKGCGHRLRGRHPEVPADQQGATAHRLGNRLKAAAHVLHYGMGVPVRKLPLVFSQLHGISLTQSALTQDALKRIDGQVSLAYERLRQDIVTRDHIHSDDTGWSIGGVLAWLMGFSSTKETYYQIRRHHGNKELREVLGEEYAGILHSDRYRSYDAKELSGVRQQKCLAHAQRNLSDLIASQRGRAQTVPRALKEYLSEAIELWQHRHEVKNFRTQAKKIQAEVDWLLRPRRLKSEGNDRIVNELGRHNDNGNLLRFLHEPEASEPTNNEAERALRGAVIARKVSHCSKVEAGARAHASFASIIATLRKRNATNLIDALCDVLTTGIVPESFPA